MAHNTFLSVKLTSGQVDGESTVKGFEKQIECLGWSWGVTHTGSAASGTGGSTGAANVLDLVVTAPVDKSFPVLSQASGTGVHVDTAIVTVCKLSGDSSSGPLAYHTITMNGGILSEVSIVGNTLDDNTSVQTMTVKFNFNAINFDYVPQGGGGAGDGSVTGTISVANST
jgi:type VI secretion system secreted protein Hcp